ncbi:MAG: hypothetical protein NTX65_00380 [Ignavibacteriales bacterium]|nr:hypothetical protein [Ignavibacteriales bacterium]
MRRIFIVLLLFITIGLLHAQSSTENWVPIVIEQDESLFINITGLSTYKGDEFFVWSLQELKSPMTMEGVDGDIYKIKTYYHINKEMMRYSILQIIYYDRQNNVIKQYSYEHNVNKPEFIFNYPITNNSDVAKILLKSFEYLNPGVEKK